MDTPIKMDDLGVPLFLETPIYGASGYHNNTLPETNSEFTPEKDGGPQKESIVFQPSIFRGELLVSGRGSSSNN